MLESYVTSKGAISHNGLYYQQLPITRYQVRFYANNYFESLPIVSTAFKVNILNHKGTGGTAQSKQGKKQGKDAKQGL